MPDLHDGMTANKHKARSDLSLIRVDLRDGSVRKGVSPADEAALIVAGLRGMGYQWLLQPEEFDATRAFRTLARAIKHRLAQPYGLHRPARTSSSVFSHNRAAASPSEACGARTALAMAQLAT